LTGASAYAGLSIISLRRAIRAGKLEACRPLARGPWLIAQESLDRFLRGEHVARPQAMTLQLP
jgi:hypothetical protein